MEYSFVIPSYQCKDTLRNTLEALNNQEGFNRDDYEVVVVDDGSTDGTKAHIENVAKNYNLKYVYLDRCSASSRARARNHGIRAAEGKIIVFIDADIIVRPNHLQEIKRCDVIGNRIIVAGLRLMVLEDIPRECIVDGNIFHRYRPRVGQRGLMEFRYDVFEALSYNAARLRYPFVFGQTCNIAVPREVIKRSGGFDEDLIAWGLEDIEAVYRLHKAGLDFVLNSRMYVLHQGHEPELKMVSERLQQGVEENTRIFLRKHPSVFDMSEAKVYDLFQSLATRFHEIERPVARHATDTVIELRQRDELAEVKQKIERYSAKEGRNIVVSDYLETTDLDIWIQLLGKRRSTPAYFPMSLPYGKNTKKKWE